MLTLTELTAAGEVLIPEGVRDALGWRPGDAVELEWCGGDDVVLRKPRPFDLDDEASYEAELTRLNELAERYRRMQTDTH